MDDLFAKRLFMKHFSLISTLWRRQKRLPQMLLWWGENARSVKYLKNKTKYLMDLRFREE